MSWFLPALTGLLLAASFPKADQGFWVWIAFVPLVAFFYKAVNPARAFWGGLIAGAVQLFFLQLWIPSVLAQYGDLPGALAWLAYGFMLILLSLFPATACFITNLLIRRGGDSCLFSFPFIWIAVEYAQTYFPFGGYPWLLTGYSQSKYLPLIQIADLTGVFGVSFIILCFNLALFWTGLHWMRRRVSAWPLISAAALILLSLLYGFDSLHRWNSIQPDFRAAMLQGNISFNDPEKVMVDKFKSGYARMADSLKFPHPDLLIIPESPAPVAFDHDPGYRQTFERLASGFSMGLVFNNIREEQAEENTRYFNSAYFMSRDGKLTDVYDKMHLVPFGEYIPMKDVFSFFRTISKDVSVFSPGRDYRIVKIGGRPANAVICFEIIFPDLVRRFVKKGSQLILNMTNDGWYGDSSAPFQHLSIARWRAVENRRYLLRAANTGVSAIIEPTGRIQTSTGILRQAVCEGRFAFVAQQTLYTRYGDVFVFLCVIIACGFVVLTVLRRVV
jgi:apolipoprotein N-acyltransferase